MGVSLTGGSRLSLKERLLPYLIFLGSALFVLGIYANSQYQQRETAPLTIPVLRTETYQGPSFSIYGGTRWAAITPTGALDMSLNTYARINRAGGVYCVTTRNSRVGPTLARIIHAGQCQAGDQ